MGSRLRGSKGGVGSRRSHTDRITPISIFPHQGDLCITVIPAKAGIQRQEI